jgi:hypothetical protein
VAISANRKPVFCKASNIYGGVEVMPDIMSWSLKTMLLICMAIFAVCIVLLLVLLNLVDKIKKMSEDKRYKRRLMSEYLSILEHGLPEAQSRVPHNYELWRNGASPDRLRYALLYYRQPDIIKELDPDVRDRVGSDNAYDHNGYAVDRRDWIHGGAWGEGKASSRDRDVFNRWRATTDRLLCFARWSAAINKQNPTPEEITLAGWSLAAIGRAVARNLKPENIDQEMKRFQELWECHFEKLKPLSDLNSQLKSLLRMREEGDVKPLVADAFAESSLANFGISPLDVKVQLLMEQIRQEEARVRETLENGVLHGIIASDCIPIGYLMHILTDTTVGYDNFVKQGVVMGLLDYLAEHGDKPNVAPLLDQCLAARARLISDSQEMSFFEVRVPSDSLPDEYAAILKIVLHYANPLLQYGDASELMRLAASSIPGVMSLLRHCPLRLIDPGNLGKEGFYQFEPFKHALWTQYIQPRGSGQVTRRYHQVLDLAAPCAAGLNVRLFTDVYRPVPVLFHEYLHFLGDQNEASVFLRTHMFSLRFYRRHRAAKPGADTVFVALCELLGKKPNPQNVHRLNDLIVRYYGPRKDLAAAEKDADETIASRNRGLLEMQKQETWHPEVWYPQLGVGDEPCGKMIRDIVIRYATTPRTITAKEFRRIAHKYMPVGGSAAK